MGWSTLSISSRSFKPAASNLHRALGIALLVGLGGGCLYNPNLQLDADPSGDDDGGAELEDGAVGDGGQLVSPHIVFNDDPSTSHGFATVRVGTPLPVRVEATCPPTMTCSYHWELGGGKTATGKDPGPQTYAQPGLTRIGLTVRDAAGQELGRAEAVVTAWTGSHSDHFDRPQLDWDAHLWLHPLDPQAKYDIVSGQLHVDHDLQLPGSSAITASPLVRDAHVEVTLRRSQTTTQCHYADIMLRVAPESRAGSFYRVRVWQGSEDHNHMLQIAIFKIVAPDDQHGIVINDPSQPPTAIPPPTWPEQVPFIEEFDPQRTQDLRVIVDVADDPQGRPTFQVTLADPANPATVFLEEPGATDITATPHTRPGFVGLAQYDGEALFDDFTLDAQ